MYLFYILDWIIFIFSNIHSYGSGYDSLGQGQPSKQDFNNYSTGNGTTGKSSGAQGSSGTGGPGKGEYIRNAFQGFQKLKILKIKYVEISF